MSGLVYKSPSRELCMLLFGSAKLYPILFLLLLYLFLFLTLLGIYLLLFPLFAARAAASLSAAVAAGAAAVAAQIRSHEGRAVHSVSLGAWLHINCCTGL